jgi:hypothetical protein
MKIRGRQWSVVGAVASLLLFAPLHQVRGDLIAWTSGEKDTVHAHYDNFNRCEGRYPGPFTAADRGTYFADLFDTHLWELTEQAFVTGGGNIYSPDVATSFLALVPNYGYGPGWTTYVFVQIRTLGSELDYEGINLFYEEGKKTRTLGWADALYAEELLREENPFGGYDVETLVIFEVPYNPSFFFLNFYAAESSMSLDQFRVDTFTFAP